MTNEEERKTIAIVDLSCNQLMEHFESVQIFVTKREGQNTQMLSRGAGNWFARYGQVRTWIIRQEEVERRSETHNQTDDY